MICLSYCTPGFLRTAKATCLPSVLYFPFDPNTAQLTQLTNTPKTVNNVATPTTKTSLITFPCLKDVYYKNTKHTTHFQKVENKINGLFEVYIDSSVTKCSRKVRVNTRLFSRSNLSTCVVIYLNISFTKILINNHLRLVDNRSNLLHLLL